MARSPKPLKHLAQAVAARLFLTPAAWMPARWSRALCSWMARRLLGRRFGPLIRSQMATALDMDTDEIRRLADRSLAHLGLFVADGARSVLGRRESLLESVDAAEAMVKIRAALEANPRGLIHIAAHLGNWELIPQVVGRAGIPYAVVGRRTVNPWLYRLVEKGRTTNGVAAFDQDANVRTLIRHLRGGGVLGLVIDQDVARLPGEFIDFLGTPAWTVSSPARIAAAARVPLQPVWCTWEDGGWVMHAGDPIPPPHSSDPADITAALTSYNDFISDLVRRHPEQWVWIHKRWETTPEKAARIHGPPAGPTAAATPGPSC